MSDNRYVTYDAHMNTVNALLRLNRQMAAFEKLVKDMTTNHSMLMDELRTIIASQDDADRRLSAMAKALSQSDILNSAGKTSLKGTQLLQLENKSDEQFAALLKNGTLKIDGLSSPDTK